jgi:hypothetical protein
MKTVRKLALASGAAIALALGTAALAQETPPTSDQAKQENQQMQDQQQTEPLSMQSSAPEEWSMLKGHDRGYLEKSDALANSWLESNFESCDRDRDGKVTEAEYTKCMKNKP